MAEVTTWNAGRPTVVKATDAAVEAVRAALVQALGGSDGAAAFVDRCGVDVLLAGHFAEASQSAHAYERFHRSAIPKATQALGNVVAYFEAGHSGKAVFLRGLEPVQFDDYDDYGIEFTHPYFSKGKRLLPLLHDAFNSCWVRHD